MDYLKEEMVSYRNKVLGAHPIKRSLEHMDINDSPEQEEVKMLQKEIDTFVEEVKKFKEARSRKKLNKSDKDDIITINSPGS